MLGMGMAAASLAVTASPAFAVRRGTLERSLSFENLHTGETLKRVYWANGQFIPDAVKDIDHILRDHRSGEKTHMDRHLFDILWELHARLGSRRPIQIISGYRSPTTNEMLRRTGGGGVAKKSLHMEGMAIDIALEDRDPSTVRKAALSLQQGGVGYYPRSGFVHVDTGKVRSW